MGDLMARHLRQLRAAELVAEYEAVHGVITDDELAALPWRTAPKRRVVSAVALGPQAPSDLMDRMHAHVAEVIRSEVERLEGDVAEAIALQDFNRIDHIMVVDDRRVLGQWSRTVASSWPDPIC